MSGVAELCVVGHPSRLGGADTELDHQIYCWQAMGINVHVCPTAPLDVNLRSMDLESRGCIYHEPADWASLQGLHCISYCNADFLRNLPAIKRYARSTTFVNCMTWVFEDELAMQEAGLIDFQLYQTRHAYERISSGLASFPKYRPVFINPYFRTEEFPFHDQRPQDKFRFGRISRADADKFGAAQLWIYETMTAPVLKEGIILGWDPQFENKLQSEPPYFIQTLPEGAMPQTEFYRICEAVIMTTDTYENLPRVGLEAMASGSVLVVDRRGGWETLVEDGKSGWLCGDEREFVYKASRCAFEHQERQAMRHEARKRLQPWSLPEAMKSWEQVFRQWEQL